MERTMKSTEEEMESKEFLKGIDLSNGQNYKRPPCPHINEKEDRIEFMQIDVDYYTQVQPC